MSIAETIKVFFLSINTFIISQMSKIRLRADPRPLTQLSASSSIDSESQAVVVEENRKPLLLQWQNVVMAFCFSSALEIAVLSAQTQLPVSFHILALAILLTFLALFVANFIGHNLTTVTQVLEFVAVILASTTVVFTIAIPFPLSLQCVTWALYAISLFVVLICRCCF